MCALYLLCPLIVPICCHATIVTLTPLIVLIIVATPQNTATPVAALAVFLAAMTITMMIVEATNPLALALTTISLLIRVYQAACLKVWSYVWMALIIWSGAMTCPKFLTIQFILIAMEIVKTLLLLLILPLTRIMNPTNHLTLDGDP